MDDAVKGYMGVVISLILFSLVLTFTAYLGISAKQITGIKADRDHLNAELKEYRQLYSYNGMTLTGDDVLIAVKRYTRVYNMYIETNHRGVIEIKASDPESFWSLDNIRRLMGDNVYQQYVSSLIEDEYKTVTGIRFSLK